MRSPENLLQGEFLQHWGAGAFGRPIRFLARVSSTQDVLREWALAEGVPEGAVVVAEEQTAGRGRQGRRWWSRPGDSLTFSLLLRPAETGEGPGGRGRILPAAARDRKESEGGYVPEARPQSAWLGVLSLAVGVALREAAGCGGLKWPNDLLAPDGRKIAGVLIETAGLGGPDPIILVGVGLNVFAPAPRGAAALDEFVAVASRGALLATLLRSLETWTRCASRDPAAVVSAWSEAAVVLGRRIRVRLPDGELTGRAVGVTPAGALVLEQGERKRIVTSGEVELLRLLD